MRLWVHEDMRVLQSACWCFCSGARGVYILKEDDAPIGQPGRETCCQSSFLLVAGCAVCCGVSHKQESGAAAWNSADFERCCQVTARGRDSRTSVFSGSARATADPAE